MLVTLHWVVYNKYWARQLDLVALNSIFSVVWISPKLQARFGTLASFNIQIKSMCSFHRLASISFNPSKSPSHPHIVPHILHVL